MNIEMFIYEVSQYFLRLSSQTYCCFRLVLSEIISSFKKFVKRSSHLRQQIHINLGTFSTNLVKHWIKIREQLKCHLFFDRWSIPCHNCITPIVYSRPHRTLQPIAIASL
jgi:hypothetical protein